MRSAHLGRRVPAALVLAGLLAGLGCGKGERGPFDVSGRVTFGGQLVPAGTIVFEPDAAQGNDGPQGFAPISGGSFDTARGGRGVVGGPHRVTILGCDGVNVSETSPQGRPLFEPFITAVDLPRADATRDFEVPARPAGKAGR